MPEKESTQLVLIVQTLHGAEAGLKELRRKHPNSYFPHLRMLTAVKESLDESLIELLDKEGSK